MAEEEINYVKEVFKSDWNLGFLGVGAFLTLVGGIGFIPLVLAGEIGALFIAQNPRVQRLIRASKNKHKKVEAEDAEKQIVQNLPPNYQHDFQSVRHLCDEIERRSNDMGDAGSNALLGGLIEKLSSFRAEYARMLRAHHLLSTRNYSNLDNMLRNEISRSERSIEREDSQQVRNALTQNLHILKKRLQRIQKLDELVRLLEARIQIVRNSLSLIQDEVYTFTNVAGISDLVDNLLTNINISDEFRSTYEDVLVAEETEAGLAALEASPVEPSAHDEEPSHEDSESSRPRNPRERMYRVK